MRLANSKNTGGAKRVIAFDMSCQFVKEMRFKSFVKFRLITDDPYILISKTIPDDWKL